MKTLISEMKLPKEMSIIIRTAGLGKSDEEIKRDQEYLIRLWNGIRELTLKSEAPQFIYEEGNLIKRTLRDLFNKGVEEVLIEGEKAFKSAKKFMELLAPDQAKHIYEYTDEKVPLFMYYQVEKQIDLMNEPFVKLPSGGSIVIHPTEALISIDVNSGKSVKESNIEETALKTNIEAADEVARQMKLRDLGGLVVIDFIDMEESKNNIAIERKMRNAVLNDRARIQIGRISPFGLLEMSRQRLASCLMDLTYQVCPHCSGTGREMTTEAAAVMLLRNIKEDVLRNRIKEVSVKMPSEVAMYILNHNRDKLSEIEKVHEVEVHIISDDSFIVPKYEMEILNNYSKKQKSFKVASDAITGSDFMKKDNSEFINVKVSSEEIEEYNKERKDDYKNFTSNKQRNRGKRGGSNRNHNSNNNSNHNKKPYNNNYKGKKPYNPNNNRNKSYKKPQKQSLLKKLFSK
jgi:ribonuclease E